MVVEFLSKKNGFNGNNEGLTKSAKLQIDSLVYFQKKNMD